MAGAIRSLLEAVLARRVAWRRQRNLAAGMHTRAPRARLRLPAFSLPDARQWLAAPRYWIAAAGLLAAAGGGVILVSHARKLAQAVEVASARGQVLDQALNQAMDQASSLPQFEGVLPGATLQVPEGGAVRVQAVGAATVLVVPDARPAPVLRVDLCAQMAGAAAASAKMVPLQIGAQAGDLARWAGAGAPGLRTVALAGPQAGDMPHIVISGTPFSKGAPLRLRWQGGPPATRWIAATGAGAGASAGEAMLEREGWLQWRPDALLRVVRAGEGGQACRAGHLLLQVMRTGSGDGAARTLVAALAPGGKSVSASLAAGRYRVPAGAATALEDQNLFEQLRSRGLVRLGADGLAELAPRDLPAWRGTAEGARAARLAAWDQVVLDEPALKLLKHAYRMADGAYVREQLRIFNGEQRLLAWRMPLADGVAGAPWQASIGAVRASVSGVMPASSARLFAAVGEGWQGWSRVALWPNGDGDGAGSATARLSLQLAAPAPPGLRLRLMLIGRASNVEGAVLRRRDAICDGRACPAPDAAQLLVFEVTPGARSVSVLVTALDMAALAMPGDQQYRHLRVADGRLDWLPLAAPSLRSAAGAVAGPSAVMLEDRNGAPLWQDGAPTAAASAAGLAPLLGIRAEHAASVAGMLARLPAKGEAMHTARLSLDLRLQAASQRAIECIGMRHGQWDGLACKGGQAPPAGRHAGLVILDAENGDILAAAGAGGAAVTAANWVEVRNFDRSDPARSPLRLPAFQHDGGAHASPGSTFKVISALGLEQAAKDGGDPQLEALLGGMPLGDINRLARRRGFAFQTDAAVYPLDPSHAHITNYKDQGLDRRAVDGRLGLAQALTYSLNTWFAWSGELSDRSLFGRAEGGVPDLQPLEPGALDEVRPIVGMARKLGFGTALRLDGGLLPPDYRWGAWDALQASAAHIDPVHTRHELRQMAIGLRMQVTPLQMALAAAAVGQGSVQAPRLLLALDGRAAAAGASTAVGVRLDRIRAGMKGVVDVGTAAGAFRGPAMARLRQGLSGKTGTAPTGSGEEATVWFTGFLQPGTLPGQTHRLAMAAFVSHSAGSGGEHAAPIIAAVLAEAARAGGSQPGMPAMPGGRRVLASVATGAEQKGN